MSMSNGHSKAARELIDAELALQALKPRVDAVYEDLQKAAQLVDQSTKVAERNIAEWINSSKGEKVLEDFMARNRTTLRNLI